MTSNSNFLPVWKCQTDRLALLSPFPESTCCWLWGLFLGLESRVSCRCQSRFVSDVWKNSPDALTPVIFRIILVCQLDQSFKEQMISSQMKVWLVEQGVRTGFDVCMLYNLVEVRSIFFQNARHLIEYIYRIVLQILTSPYHHVVR